MLSEEIKIIRTFTDRLSCTALQVSWSSVFIGSLAASTFIFISTQGKLFALCGCMFMNSIYCFAFLSSQIFVHTQGLEGRV